jgi:hypothetical protein
MQVDNTVVPTVSLSVNALGPVATFTATATNAGTAPTYQWLVNGVAVPGATLSVFAKNNLSNLDSVCCEVTSSGACAGTIGSACVTIHISGVGVKPVIAGNSDVVVVPNPNKGQFTVKGNFGANIDEEVTLEIVNMLGQVVYNTKLMTNNGAINEKVQTANKLANGMYILNLRSVSENKVFHLVIEQ